MKADVERFIKKTLLAALVPEQELFNVTKQALAMLQRDQLLLLPTEAAKGITSTPLGWAVFGSALELKEIKFVHGELQQARRRYSEAKRKKLRCVSLNALWALSVCCLTGCTSLTVLSE